MLRPLRALAVGLAMILASLAYAPPATAADGWVYVVVNDRVCGTAGTKVRDVQANFNWGGGSSTINWEGDGDNIVYPRVRLNTRVTYQINARCFRKSGWVWVTVGYRVVTGSFTASRHQQTIWVG
jgi:hypothetical protein